MEAEERDRIRQKAVDLFNGTWELLDRKDRAPGEDLRMIHMAHASRALWEEVGEPVNLARGEWQCSRVYAVLGRGEPAIFHGTWCLDLCEANGIGDFDLAYAHEALARAFRVAGNEESALRHLALAERAADAIVDPEDREHFDEDLATLRS